MVSPCHKHCPDRAVECHISCERYKAYRNYLDERNEQIRKEKAVYGYKGIKRREYLGYSPKYTGGYGETERVKR